MKRISCKEFVESMSSFNNVSQTSAVTMRQIYDRFVMTGEIPAPRVNDMVFTEDNPYKASDDITDFAYKAVSLPEDLPIEDSNVSEKELVESSESEQINN